MPFSKFIKRNFLLAGFFILGLFIFSGNNFAKEIKPDDNNSQITLQRGEETSAEPKAASEVDVNVMMSKLASARDLLDTFWRETFAKQNIRYTTPKVVAFTGAVQTPCGVIGRGNAAYCVGSHSIYFDVNFFAGMMKLTADNLNTDGDMAVISVLAHEWGHAVQFQTRMLSRLSIVNELQADCLSGAFARYATDKGMLEEGDTKEAAFAFAMGGDKAPWYAPQAHGDSRMRVGKFSLGFEQGLSGCRQ